MDEKALRLEQIKLDVATNEQVIQLQARRHVTVFAVAMTTGAGALAGGTLGHVGALPVVGVTIPSAAVVAFQIRALGHLVVQLNRGRAEGRAAIERLIEPEEQPNERAPREDGP